MAKGNDPKRTKGKTVEDDDDSDDSDDEEEEEEEKEEKKTAQDGSNNRKYSDSNSDSDNPGYSDSNSDSDYPPNYSYSDCESDWGDDDKPKEEADGDPVPAFDYDKWAKEMPEKEATEAIDEFLKEREKYIEDLEDKVLAMPEMEDRYNFPKDDEDWREEDLKELWTDPPVMSVKSGWDPVWVDETEWKEVRHTIQEGKDFPLAPFYVPYRKPYPIIPDYKPRLPLGVTIETNLRIPIWNKELRHPKDIVEELSKTEEFLKWVSYVFADGSTYEGTVWDDVAQGKGVYTANEELVRYEGEWLRNEMEGHGVVEVDIPDIEPIPGTKLEAEMRAKGRIIKRDYVMDEEDKKWLEMDIEDSVQLTRKKGGFVTPFYDNDVWIKYFGRKPEKGRYRYAGQWKHSRMHGCGVYEVNEKTIYGRFYFGELVLDPYGCNEETCALHAGIAEVAAAKARMFVNKPDGMVREQRGPYGDPQHPYFYEEEDVWHAPGFINQFYEVPDYWKQYTHDVDQEREMWLNSFYKAPLRLPMPAELEHWWSNEEDPEFVLVNKEAEPDPEDPSKLVFTEDPLIVHTKTGMLINYIEDEEHGLRLFWQPPREKEGELDVEKVQFLPLGFDEFDEAQSEEEKLKEEEERKEEEEKLKQEQMKALSNICESIQKWAEKKKEEAEMRKKLIEKEMDLVEANLCWKEAIEDMDEDEIDEEEEAMAEVDAVAEEDFPVPPPSEKEDKAETKEEEEEAEEEEEEEEEEDEYDAPASFGTVGTDRDSATEDRNGNKSGKSPFSTLSLATSRLISTVPSSLQKSFLSWKKGLLPQKVSPCTRPCEVASKIHSKSYEPVQLVSFHKMPMRNLSLRAAKQSEQRTWVIQQHRHTKRKLRMLASSLNHSRPKGPYYPEEPGSCNLNWLHGLPEDNSDCILSLQVPVGHFDPIVDDGAP